MLRQLLGLYPRHTKLASELFLERRQFQRRKSDQSNREHQPVMTPVVASVTLDSLPASTSGESVLRKTILSTVVLPALEQWSSLPKATKLDILQRLSELQTILSPSLKQTINAAKSEHAYSKSVTPKSEVTISSEVPNWSAPTFA